MNIFKKLPTVDIDEFKSLVEKVNHQYIKIDMLTKQLNTFNETLEAHKLHATTLDILTSGVFTWEKTKTDGHHLLKLEWKESVQRLYTPDKAEYHKRELAEKLAIRCKEMS